MTNIEIVKDFINAYNSFNIDNMLKWLHPEIKFKNISGGKVNVETSGIKEFEELSLHSPKLFREREQKIITLKVDGNTVRVELDYYAVLSSNDVIKLKGRSEYIFRNGLIYSITDES